MVWSTRRESSRRRGCPARNRIVAGLARATVVVGLGAVRRADHRGLRAGAGTECIPAVT